MKPLDPCLLRVAPATRRPIAALAAMGTLAGVATVATAFALTALVVAVVEGRPIVTAALWLATLYVARGLLAAGNDVVGAWAGVALSTRLRSALLRRWATLDAATAPERGTAVTLATSGVSAVEPYAARYLPTLVTAAVVPVLAIGTLAVVDWPSAIIVVLTVPLLPLFAALIGHATAESTQRRWSALAALSGHFLDVVRGLPTLVSYGRARRQVDTVRDVSERHRRATMETLRIAFLSSAALELLATISVALVAVTVGIRLAAGSMGLESALVAILLAPEAYWPIRRVGAEFHAAADGAAALDDILTHLEPAPVRPPASDPPRVVAHRLTYTYAAGLPPVIRDIDLVAGWASPSGDPSGGTSGVTSDVTAGLTSGGTSVVAAGLTVITGPSGVGKSTLLDLIAGLRTPTSGTISAPAVHYVTQRPFLTAGSLRAALTIGHPATDEWLWAALRAVDLDGLVAGLDGGLAADLGDDGFGLSAGQRQRLALARAWLSPEPVLLVDEPTAHLDGPAAESARALIVALAAHRVVVAVTHDGALVAHADQHVHLAPATSVPRDEITRLESEEVLTP